MSENEDSKVGIKWASRDEGVPTIYVNHVQMLVGPFDFTLRLGQLGFFESEEGIAARELVRVFMSPQHLKSLRDLLSRQVEAYEGRFGEILDLHAKILEQDIVLGAEKVASEDETES